MRQAAFQAVLRACLFAALAIFCLMMGLSFDLHMAFRTGGTVTLLMAIVLVLKAVEARRKPYKRTEMWLLIPKDRRPPDAYAQRVSATVLRETYLSFALWTSAAAIAMWTVVLFLSLGGQDIGIR